MPLKKKRMVSDKPDGFLSREMIALHYSHGCINYAYNNK